MKSFQAQALGIMFNIAIDFFATLYKPIVISFDLLTNNRDKIVIKNMSKQIVLNELQDEVKSAIHHLFIYSPTNASVMESL